jgi:hypothetical protein
LAVGLGILLNVLSRFIVGAFFYFEGAYRR